MHGTGWRWLYGHQIVIRIHFMGHFCRMNEQEVEYSLTLNAEETDKEVNFVCLAGREGDNREPEKESEIGRVGEKKTLLKGLLTSVEVRIQLSHCQSVSVQHLLQID